MAPTFVSGIPIYVQIADDIRAQILRGALRAGDQLTSTTEYSATYRINPATVGKAFAILVDEGLVEKRRGIGMFVAEGAQHALVADGLATYVEETLNPAVEAGLALGLDIDAIIDHVRAYGADTNTKDNSCTPSTPSPHLSGRERGGAARRVLDSRRCHRHRPRRPQRLGKDDAHADPRRRDGPHLGEHLHRRCPGQCR